MRIAPLFGCSVTSAFGVVNNDAKIKIGQSILIFGVGGVGLNVAQAASMVSAYPIVGIDLYDHKIDMGKKFGLTHGITDNLENIKNKIYNIVGDKGADVAIETTGNPKVIEKAYELTASHGKTILVGVPNNKISIYSVPLHFKKILTGSHGGDSIPDIDIPRYIRLINQKKMTLENLITHEFKLTDINKAIELFRSGKAGRIVIKIN
jgi:S-(hydroxymethyl)glutathione dehydrogenase/alcohol dehydrogenase